MIICLEQGADLHIAQLMPLPLTISCFSKIQIGFTCLVLAHLGSPGQTAVKRVCVCVLHKWGLAQSPSCDCGHRETMNHIVNTCPLTKFEGGLELLHEADDYTVICLKSTVTAALAK